MGATVKLEIVANSTRLDISDINNFMWQSHAGFGLAPVHRQTIRGPQQSGDTDMGFLLDPRNIMLSIRIMGTSLDDLFSKQAQLLQMTAPSASALSLCFTRLASGIVRQIDGYAVGGLDFASAQRGGFTLVTPIMIRSNDPTWYDPTTGFVGFSVGGGSGTLAVPLAVPINVGASTINASQAINYAGTADSYPFMTITGPITNPILTVADGTNTYALDFTGVTIAGGDTRVIDTRYPNKTVVDASGTNKVGDLTTASALATLKITKLSPGETTHANTVTISGSSVNSATRIDVNYFTRFIGV